MNYDLRVEFEYEYRPPVAGGRHLVRIAPMTVPDSQRVIASSIAFDPVPDERLERRDFFGNALVAVSYRDVHAGLKVALSARVRVDAPGLTLDVSPGLARLKSELAETLSLAPASPHHFTAASPRVPLDDEITAYARKSADKGNTAYEIVRHLGERINGDFIYDGDSTEVETPPQVAFQQKRGVCQDFTHVMIAGLRGIGIPAGYVSGYLRTLPPPGKPRLAGADAMHAWVRAWCGKETGWVAYDPTNRTFASEDHIVAAIGRDYDDVAPIAGILRTSGSQETTHSVDVAPIAEKSRN
jgi:transglutaminase-like putative cysteine protease